MAEQFKKKYPNITYADLYQVLSLVQLAILCVSTTVTAAHFPHCRVFLMQLAGVVAVEITGGPTINFVCGRKVRPFLDQVHL